MRLMKHHPCLSRACKLGLDSRFQIRRALSEHPETNLSPDGENAIGAVPLVPPTRTCKQVLDLESQTHIVLSSEPDTNFSPLGENASGPIGPVCACRTSRQT